MPHRRTQRPRPRPVAAVVSSPSIAGNPPAGALAIAAPQAGGGTPAKRSSSLSSSSSSSVTPKKCRVDAPATTTTTTTDGDGVGDTRRVVTDLTMLTGTGGLGVRARKREARASPPQQQMPSPSRPPRNARVSPELTGNAVAERETGTTEGKGGVRARRPEPLLCSSGDGVVEGDEERWTNAIATPQRVEQFLPMSSDKDETAANHRALRRRTNDDDGASQSQQQRVVELEQMVARLRSRLVQIEEREASTAKSLREIILTLRRRLDESAAAARTRELTLREKSDKAESRIRELQTRLDQAEKREAELERTLQDREEAFAIQCRSTRNATKVRSAMASRERADALNTKKAHATAEKSRAERGPPGVATSTMPHLKKSSTADARAQSPPVLDTVRQDGPKGRCWDGRLQELRQFKDEHGHCNVPAGSGQLSTWVSNQRLEYRKMEAGEKTSMTEARVAALEALGFEWRLRTRGRWEDRLEELRRYKEEQGHCNVPTRSGQLGRWVHNQRTEYRKMEAGRKSSMTEERRAALEALGFEWRLHQSACDAAWKPDGAARIACDKSWQDGGAARVMADARIARNCEERKKNGSHCGECLYAFRNCKCSGWPNRGRWEARFEELRRYKNEHGHCNVAQGSGQLGKWVSTQRTQYRKMAAGEKSSMTEDRIAALEELGFVWKDSVWHLRYDELRHFKEKHGHCVVPARSGQLGSWVTNQRREYRKMVSGENALMTEDRRIALEDLGFVWLIYGRK